MLYNRAMSIIDNLLGGNGKPDIPIAREDAGHDWSDTNYGDFPTAVGGWHEATDEDKEKGCDPTVNWDDPLEMWRDLQRLARIEARKTQKALANWKPYFDYHTSMFMFRLALEKLEGICSIRKLFKLVGGYVVNIPPSWDSGNYFRSYWSHVYTHTSISKALKETEGKIFVVFDYQVKRGLKATDATVKPIGPAGYYTLTRLPGRGGPARTLQQVKRSDVVKPNGKPRRGVDLYKGLIPLEKYERRFYTGL